MCDAAVKVADRSQLPVHETVAFRGIFLATFIGLYPSARGEATELRPMRPARLLIHSNLDVVKLRLCRYRPASSSLPHP